MKRNFSGFCVIYSTFVDKPNNLIVASKKTFPLAVERNRAKRRARSAIRVVLASGIPATDRFTFVLNRKVLAQKFIELKKDVLLAIQRK